MLIALLVNEFSEGPKLGVELYEARVGVPEGVLVHLPVVGGFRAIQASAKNM